MDIERWAKFLHGIIVESIYFGGGTPSVIPEQYIGMIVSTINKFFHISEHAEISLEANPDSLSFEKTLYYKKIGINRISLGIQVLDDDFLKILGRVHTKRQALESIHHLKKADFPNIGFDLMWGLPSQTFSHWKQTLSEAVALDPQHISCYGLTLEENTPLYDKKNILRFPSEKEQEDMFLYTSDYLSDHGYMHYEVSNYAKNSKYSRHNMGYWLGKDYLGIGPSAVSTLQGYRFTQPSDFLAWINLDRTKDISLPHQPESSHLSKQIIEEEFIMLRLRTSTGISFDEYKKRTNKNFLSDNKDFISALIHNNLAIINQTHFRLTEKGFLVSNAIIERFFESV